MSQHTPSHIRPSLGEQTSEQQEEQKLKVMIQEALGHDLAQQTSDPSQQSQFERLWLQAEKTAEANSTKSKSKKQAINPAMNPPYFEPKPWFLTPVLLVIIWLGLQLVPTQPIPSQNKNEHAIVQTTDLDFDADHTLVALTAVDPSELNDYEDHLSWLDHDDWSLNPDL